MIRRILRTSTPSRIAVLVCALASLLIAQELSAQTALTHPEGLPEWAFNIPDENAAYGPMRPEGIVRVPGSAIEYDAAEIAGSLTPPDWFPDDHAPLPEVVARGAGENVRACASCHLTSGMGHPESSQLAGLPVGYMMRQMADFESGARTDRFWMNGFAEAISDEDALAAAEYYAAIEPIDWVDVIESDTVPTHYVGDGRMRFRHPDGGTEPLGNRILEFPQDRELATARHPYTGFVAYAPVGSIARGEELATTGGGGRTIQCTICHGEGLTGLAEIPGIAGASPIYTVRQLNDIKTGARSGPMTALMIATVANLTEEDIVALAAYLASLDP